MQGKGLIKVFLVLLILVTLMQLFYMLPTRKVEKAADSYAQERVANIQDADEANSKAKQFRAAYLDSVSGDEIFKIPLLSGFTYDDLKSKQLNFGLDLKGGMSSTLQVDLKELLVRLSKESTAPNFNEALNNAEDAQKSSQSDFISLFHQEYEKLGGGSLAKIFSRDPVLKEKLNLQSSNGEVIQLLRETANSTVELTFNRLKQRIDKLGVTQPNVTLDAARDLIQVEMPGIDNPERARKFLGATAELEFWDTYRFTDSGIQQAIQQADRALGGGVEEDTAIEYDTIYTPKLDSLGQETGEQSMEIVPREQDAFGNNGPLLSRLTVNNGTFPRTVIGVAPKNERNEISKLLARPEVTKLFPSNLEFVWANKPYFDIEAGEQSNEYELYMIKKQVGTDKAPLEGDVIVEANAAPNPTGEMAVNIRMNSEGAKKWGQMTERAANNGNREIAIVLDNEVFSAPRVNGAITQGRSEISGNFSVQEANDLSSILEVGKLPAKTRSIQEAIVGPSLGAQNVSASMKALAFGLVLVLLFMVVYYGGGGIISIIALLLNIFFIIGALASLGTVLTVPGIAGIVLTIGMAVDANVIIFERIREELRAGKGLLASVADGFSNSYSAIIDANVTTLLTAAVLAYFGLGPIKGFAVVLIIGVLCSLFTAVLVGRMIIDWWVGKGNNLSFWTGGSKNMFANMNIDWIGKRKITYVISGVLIVAGLISMATKGFDWGVEFTGGYSYNVQFSDDMDVSAETLREGLTAYLGDNTKVKAVDLNNTFNILTSYKIDETGTEVANEVMAKLHEAVVGITGDNVTLDKFKLTDIQNGTHVVTSSKVGPTIADDIANSSLYAGIFAILLIFLYLFLRFNKWQYSLGAVAALVHDSLIVLGLFSIFHGILPFSLEVDQAFIAAILTVIGYSINDTVVVFDRIREDLGIYTKENTDDVINKAINSTFSRTIITSLTTFFVMFVLIIFGGASTKGFAFALLIGVIVGTYSSIFVATPIVRDLTDNLRTSKKEVKKRFSKALN